MIFQREVGTKVKDFKTGLVDAVRANPTTIVIGEIRDAETALEAASVVRFFCLKSQAFKVSCEL
jgi:Tfp pilus assembly pilus retraction ATPase PilT